MTTKRHLAIALGLFLLICSQLIEASQNPCVVTQRFNDKECCGESLMDSAGNVVIEAHSPLKYKGRFNSMKARLCGNDILWVQLWEMVSPNSYEFRLVWQVKAYSCSVKKGWYLVNFPNNTAVVTDNTRLGYYSQSIVGSTEDKFAIPYLFNGTEYKMYHSNVTFNDPNQLHLGDVFHFDDLRFPRSFEPNIVFCVGLDCMLSRDVPEAGQPGGRGGENDGGNDERGPVGPPGPPGATGAPGTCPGPCLPGTEGFPELTCDVGEIRDMDRKLDSVKDDTEGTQRDVRDLRTILNELLKSQHVTGTCPEGFLAATYGIGSCYIIIREPAQYGVALMHCRDNYGANLLAIETDQEQAYIKKEVIGSKVGDPLNEIFWTAGMNSKTTTSAWIWYDGTKYPAGKKRINANHWATGQPRSANSDQRCLKLIIEPGTNNGEWQAAVCEEWHYYICEIPKKCL